VDAHLQRVGVRHPVDDLPGGVRRADGVAVEPDLVVGQRLTGPRVAGDHGHLVARDDAAVDRDVGVDTEVPLLRGDGGSVPRLPGCACGGRPAGRVTGRSHAARRSGSTGREVGLRGAAGGGSPGRGRRVERHPALAREVDLHPRVRVLPADGVSPEVRPLGGRVARDVPRRDALGPEHRDHPRGEVLAVARIQLEQEAVGEPALRPRRVERVALGRLQPPLDRDGFLVRRLRVGRDVRGQPPDPCGRLCRELGVPLDDGAGVVRAGASEVRDGPVGYAAGDGDRPARFERRRRLEAGVVDPRLVGDALVDPDGLPRRRQGPYLSPGPEPKRHPVGVAGRPRQRAVVGRGVPGPLPPAPRVAVVGHRPPVGALHGPDARPGGTLRRGRRPVDPQQRPDGGVLRLVQQRCRGDETHDTDTDQHQRQQPPPIHWRGWRRRRTNVVG